MVAVVGAGGHGQDVAAILKANGQDCHFYDDAKGAPITAGQPSGYLIGINDPGERRRMAERLTLLGWDVGLGHTIHPSAIVGPDCTLGRAVVIGPLASLLTNVRISRHTHIGAGSHLTRCAVGAFTTIAPGVTICGDVQIGSGCLIGAGATIRNLVTIGDNVTVGAGAVVVNDLPDGVTVRGVPAR